MALPNNEAIIKSIEIDLKNQSNPFLVEDFRDAGLLASEFGIEQFKIAMSPSGLNLSINQSRKLARLIYNTTGRKIGRIEKKIQKAASSSINKAGKVARIIFGSKRIKVVKGVLRKKAIS